MKTGSVCTLVGSLHHLLITCDIITLWIQGYRLISGLVARPWCLIEITSRPEIIEIVSDTRSETNKIGLDLFQFSFVKKPSQSLVSQPLRAGMEARHRCCEAVFGAFTSSSKLLNDPAYSGLTSKVCSTARFGTFYVCLSTNRSLDISVTKKVVLY